MIPEFFLIYDYLWLQAVLESDLWLIYRAIKLVSTGMHGIKSKGPQIFWTESVTLTTVTWSFALTTQYMPKVNSRNATERLKICLKLTIKIPERRVSIVDFEQVNICWDFFLLSWFP